MSYKCRVCGSNDVENPGDICEFCAMKQAPSAAVSGAAGRRKTRKILINGTEGDSNHEDSCDNSMIVQPEQESEPEQEPEPSVQTCHAGQKANEKAPITAGIIKNISVNTKRYSFLQKWFKTLFSGIPFTDNIIMFQVFPEGTSLNAVGNAYDQVIVYGKVSDGAIVEDHEVEVYGRRDSSNNIVAGAIRNKTDGTTVSPERTVGAVAVWIITLVIFAGIAAAFGGLGFEGIMALVLR